MSSPASQPQTTNEGVAQANEVIHSLVFDAAVKAVEAEMISALPFLGLPVVKQITSLIVLNIAQKFYAKISSAVDFAIIDKQVTDEMKSVKAATEQLKNSIQSGVDIGKSVDEFEKSFGALIHSDGSAPQ